MMTMYDVLWAFLCIMMLHVCTTLAEMSDGADGCSDTWQVERIHEFNWFMEKSLSEL